MRDRPLYNYNSKVANNNKESFQSQAHNLSTMLKKLAIQLLHIVKKKKKIEDISFSLLSCAFCKCCAYLIAPKEKPREMSHVDDGSMVMSIRICVSFSRSYLLQVELQYNISGKSSAYDNFKALILVKYNVWTIHNIC